MTKPIGRPATGQSPQVSFRLAPKMLADIDAAAAHEGKSRTKMLEVLLKAGLLAYRTARMPTPRYIRDRLGYKPPRPVRSVAKPGFSFGKYS